MRNVKLPSQPTDRMPSSQISEPAVVSGQVVSGQMISGQLLTRNWALNLLGWVVPLSVALFAIPYVVRGLGAERFGVLSIASALLGYFGIFDLGLGRATTKFVAELLARREPESFPKLCGLRFGCNSGSA